MHYHNSSLLQMSNNKSNKKEEDLEEVQWKISKVLGEADVALDRMLKFNRVEADHILLGLGSEKAQKVKDGEALRVEMYDVDTCSWHVLLFKKVKRGCVLGFKLGWVSHFVVRRRLLVGDEIGIFVDPATSFFYFCVLSRTT